MDDPISTTGSALAITDSRGRLRIARREGAGWRSDIVAEQGAWPAWAPDGRWLAASSVDLGAGTSAIDIVDRGGSVVETLYRGEPSGTPVIAPGVPHYVCWSPHGSLLSFVAPVSAGLALFVKEVGDPLPAARLITGAPLFFAWSQDERYLAAHAGTDLVVFDVAERRRLVSIPGAAGFRTPCFTATGDAVVYAVPSPPGVVVREVTVAGGAVRDLAVLPGGIALAQRPGTRDLAVAVSRQPETGIFEELYLVPGETWEERTRIARGSFVAAHWDPSGSRIALTVPAQTGDGRHAFRIVDTDGTTLAATEAVFLAGPQRTLISFFDQYALSHPLWAPDGSMLVFAGRMPGDGVHSTFGDPVNRVIGWAAGRGEALSAVAEGEIGFFPFLVEDPASNQ